MKTTKPVESSRPVRLLRIAEPALAAQLTGATVLIRQGGKSRTVRILLPSGELFASRTSQSRVYWFALVVANSHGFAVRRAKEIADCRAREGADFARVCSDPVFRAEYAKQHDYPPGLVERWLVNGTFAKWAKAGEDAAANWRERLAALQQPGAEQGAEFNTLHVASWHTRLDTVPNPREWQRPVCVCVIELPE